MLAILEASRAAVQIKDLEKPRYFANLDILSDDFVRTIHNSGGDSALFRLKFLMMTSSESDFRAFCVYLKGASNVAKIFDNQSLAPLKPDNALLPAGPNIDRFAHNVLTPSLSRKLFNPGCRPGYLVYGLLHPRILVSLPFKGVTEYFYDVYSNSLDIATSLNARGYFGTFLMFDYMQGLNHDVDGVPAWLIFFSLIATNSDLVIFIEEEGGLTDAQRMEAALTPDRVPKKIVTLHENELTWAKRDDTQSGLMTLHIGEEGLMSEEEAMEKDAEFAMPLIQMYERTSFPDDRLIVVGDESLIEVYPYAYSVPHIDMTIFMI